MTDRPADNQRVLVRLIVEVEVLSSDSWTQGHTMGQIIDQGTIEAEGKLRRALGTTGSDVRVLKIQSKSVVAQTTGSK